MARLIEFFSQTGELVLDPFAGVGGTLLGAAIARGPRRAHRHRARSALGRRLRRRRPGPVGRAGRRSGRSSPTSAPPTRADRAASIRPGSSCGSAMRWRSCRRSTTGSVDFVATDPPYNLQLPMTMAGGAARRDPRQPPDRLRDGHRLSRRPGQRRRLPGVPRADGRRSSASCVGSCATAATRWSSCATRTRTGATCSPAPTSRRGPRRSGFVPKGDLIWYQAGTRLRPYGYPRAFVPNIVHQHILVLRKESRRRQSRRGGATRGRPRGRRCRRRPRPSSSVSAAIGIVATGPIGRGAVVLDDVAEGHLVDPALAAVRAQHQPVGAVLLEQLDLVALVEVADLDAAQLVGRVEQADDAIADDPPLATVERADEAVVEGQARGRRRRRGSDRPCGPGCSDGRRQRGIRASVSSTSSTRRTRPAMPSTVPERRRPRRHEADAAAAAAAGRRRLRHRGAAPEQPEGHRRARPPRSW